MAYWLMRSEPDVYGWDDLVKEGETEWDGVRNYAARNFLKEMQPGEERSHNGSRFKCVPTSGSDDCTGCHYLFRSWRTCIEVQKSLGECIANVRTDLKNVIFQKVDND